MPQSSVFSIFDNAGARLALTYNGLTMNDPASAIDSRIEVKRLRARIGTRYVLDDRQHSDGSEVQDAFKTRLELDLTARILRPSRALLYDACQDVAAAFDPALVSRNNQSTRGFLAFDGSSPTADTANYPSGLIAKRLYVRPVEPILPIVVTGGNVRAEATRAEAWFQAAFMAQDPRVYLQAESSLAITGTSQVATNTKADYASWPTLTMTVASTAGAAVAFNNTIESLPPLTVDLSGLAGHQVVIDMDKHKITVAGIERPERYVSGDWFEVHPGSNTITVSSITGISAATLTWRPALAY